MKNRTSRKRLFLSGLNNLSRRSVLILLIGLPTVAIASLALLPDLIYISANYHDYAELIYPDYFEHIAMTLLIVIGGALIFDIAEKKDIY